MPTQVVNARIRGFICLNAHPAGCAANVRQQIDTVERVLAQAPGARPSIGDALVIGSSTGYGLSSLITTAFGHRARAVGVCLERPPQGDKTASAGWYNLVEAHRLASAAGRPITTFNGDAYSREVKDQVIQHLKSTGARLDTVVYSLASPKRTDPATGVSWTSVLKPLGAPFRSKSVSLSTDQVTEVEIGPASEPADVEATRKVMGGEDWELWLSALLDAGVLAPGCRTVAYSYIGPELTYPIYRSGTIGRAKEHLELTARTLHARLADRLGGAAYVSVNKALTTQASSAIPVVPLYIGILYRVMKAKGTHEGTAEQIARLYRDHLAPGRQPRLDADGRIRLDDLEMDPATQAEVLSLWSQVTSDNLFQITDYASFKQEFRALFGFEVPSIDYAQPVETDVTW